MTNILKIDSSGQYEGSISRKLTARLAKRLLTAPNATLIERDVAKGLPVVSESWIGSNFTPKEDRTPEQTEILGLSDSLVEELRNADTIIIGMPIYNFSMPGALKNWVDLICRAGETFQYTETGPEGLLNGKRAYVVVASGGVPIGSPVDFASTHLKQVLNFIGITDIKFISATAMMANAEAVIKAAESEIDQLAAA
ncbi:MAG: NAD(P)H-dependent oxidoreductase [Rhodobacteraceae bacterium]|nr:NAD(P)H-dependent oxidoreductase [Paracoccaceae bacterium]